MAEVFQFKQFSVDQTACAMKINTDGVLLGALAEAKSPESIIDIGTGTGVIALMLAQRFPDALIEAVEIDESAAQTAKANFANSFYANRLTIFNSSFEGYFIANPNRKYNLIVSNPPFYINSLTSPGAGKNLAKHADASFFETLIAQTAVHLTDNGGLWLILPLPTAELVKKLANAHSLHLMQLINVRSYPQSDPHREILVFGRQQTKTTQQDFVIYDALKKYSGQYQTALQDFFTIFP
jgi:tRNA1Val (adenine37-N6)-methyltransferase